MTYDLLFVMELKTRRVHVAGTTTEPNETRLLSLARELTNHADGFLLGKRFLIMDQDAKFSKAFRQTFSDEGIKPVQTSPYAPNMNAHLERFFGSLKSECLNRLIFFGERSLRNAVRIYLDHYHSERSHQGLDNKLIIPMKHPTDTAKAIIRDEKLGGLLRSYCRAA